MSDPASIPELMAAALAEAKRVVNGSTGLSKALGGRLTPQAISQWRQVPAARVLDVERVTGISRHDLRPDLYPTESAA